MYLARQIEKETLDDLDRFDPNAQRSRRDLQRINYIIGSARHIASALGSIDHPARRIIELGAGDGTLMLRLAKHLSKRWLQVHLTLLDRQNLISQSTHQAFVDLGWTLEILPIDIVEWTVHHAHQKWDVAIANLFIHHLDAPSIAALFATLEKRVDNLIVCEPRRDYRSLLASRLVRLVGANAVTRQDAVLSVKAGFRDQELSCLWPKSSTHWHLSEHPSGLFSHRFIASRREVNSGAQI